jgi:hypothetical protein
MKNSFKILSAAAVFALLAGCSDYLTGGDLSNDPNRPVSATNGQLFVGLQANIFGIFGGDPARTTGIWAQQFTGAQSQYLSNIQAYQITEANTNGLQTTFYGGGGLVDDRKLEAGALAAKDTAFLGVAQLYEAMLMGTAADLFGDIVYSQALGPANPTLDNQLDVYDALQTLLSTAIVNMQKAGTGTNFGPQASDLVYGGDVSKYVTLAHTLKARFYMHTAEVRPGAYAQALAEAAQGIKADSGNYVGAFFDASGNQNLWYQFEIIQGRTGYVIPDSNFIALLASRGDPRRAQYFNAAGTDLSAARLSPSFKQPFVTYDENTLIWAEAAYRTGNIPLALAKLTEERANHGLTTAATLTGNALLTEILTEKYIADFQLGNEAFNDYQRTCFPNLPRTGVAGAVMPGRYYYDASERQTDTNIPEVGTAPNTLKNRDNPKNATADGVGGACLAQ